MSLQNAQRLSQLVYNAVTQDEAIADFMEEMKAHGVAVELKLDAEIKFSNESEPQNEEKAIAIKTADDAFLKALRISID